VDIVARGQCYDYDFCLFLAIWAIFGNFRRFSAIFGDFRRFSAIFGDFRRFSLIFGDFRRFMVIFANYRRFSQIFGEKIVVCLKNNVRIFFRWLNSLNLSQNRLFFPPIILVKTLLKSQH
jgi:hypothetical protein